MEKVKKQQYLTRPLEVKPFQFHFYLIKNNNLNAFAGPGGHIFIYSGLVDVMEEIDELAAVLCHEIAHVYARHIAQRIEQNKKIGLATMAGALAGALKALSAFDESVGALEKALEKDPDALPILIHLSEAYQQNGQDRESLTVLEKCLKINDRDLRNRIQKAREQEG